MDEGFRWHAADAKGESLPPVRQQVSEMLSETAVPKSAPEIAAALCVDVKTVQNVIAVAIAMGTPIEKTGAGCKGDPYRYRMAAA